MNHAEPNGKWSWIAGNVRWLVLAVVAFASASAYLTRYCISAANTTIQQELGFDDAQLGHLMGAFGLGYLIFQFPGGWLGSQFGTRLALALLSVCWSLCNVWTAASSMLHSLWLARFGLGLFQAGLTPNSAKIVNDWIPVRDRGISSASIAASMSLGAAATMSMTGWLLTREIPWRGIFVGYALVGVAWAFGFIWFFRTLPQNHSWVSAAELKRINLDRPNDPHQSPQPLKPNHTPTSDQSDSAARRSGSFGVPRVRGVQLALDMLTSFSLWGLMVQAFFRAAGYVFYVTWFFAYLEYAFGITKSQAGLLNSLPLLAVVAGSLCGGMVIDTLFRRSNSKRVSRAGTAFVSLILCGLFTMASAWTNSAGQLAVVIAAGAFFAGIGSPAAWAATIDIGGSRSAAAMSAMNTAGCLAGVLLPMLLGAWFKQIRISGGDWDLVIYLHAAFYFAGALSWLVIDPNRVIRSRPAGEGA